jgi:hypothetical protein
MIDVLWSPNVGGPASLPVTPGRKVTLVRLDGTSVPLTPAGDAVALTINGTPIIVVQAP